MTLDNLKRPFNRLAFHHIVTCCSVVGPSHNGIARPQVADRGTASFMEGGCE